MVLHLLFSINTPLIKLVIGTNTTKLILRGLGGLPTRLIKGRAGSVQSGSAGADDGSLQDESSLDGEENEKQ